MQQKTHYKNGQSVFIKKGTTLTYFFQNGDVKAKGKEIDESMEGTWIFNRESGELWQVGIFLHNQKHGSWIRYNKHGAVEYNAIFQHGQLTQKVI